jgi:Putative transposase
MVQGAMPHEPGFEQELCADERGHSLHAAVRRDGEDRKALEQLCCYIAHPAVANGRL